MDYLDLEDELHTYLTECGAVPPIDAATIRLDGSLVVNLTDLYEYSSSLVDILVKTPDEALKHEPLRRCSCYGCGCLIS